MKVYETNPSSSLTQAPTVTPTDISVSDHMLTMEEAKKMSAEELIELLNRDSDKNNSFSFKTHCAFSRSFATDLLRTKHHYQHVQGWFPCEYVETLNGTPANKHTSYETLPRAEPETLLIGQTHCECERRLLTVPKDIYDRWVKFNGNILNKSVTLGYALERFMTDCENNRVRLVVKFTD